MSKAPETSNDLSASGKPPRPIWRFVRDYALKEWRLLSLGLLLSALTAAATTSYAILLKLAGDWLADLDQRLLWLPPLIIAAATIKALALYGQTLINNTAVQRALVDIQAKLFSALMDGPFARLASEAAGSLVARFINDMNVIREATLRLANNLAKSTLTVIGGIIAMFWFDWALALMVLIVYPIAFAPIVRLGERIRKNSKRAQEQTGEVSALLTEAFLGGRTIKAYGLETYQKSRADEGFLERAALYIKVLRGRAAVDPILEVVGGLAFAGVLGFAGWRILNGAASIGDLLGFIGALAAMSPEVRALGTLNSVLQEAKAALERVFLELDAPDELAIRGEIAGSQPDADRMGELGITFEDVHFNYPDGSAALKGLSFKAKAGETIAFVGASGAGKSTILNLLLGLYAPNKGEINIGERSISDWSLGQLRHQMALVSQDAFLFNDSLKNNIAQGRSAFEAEAEAIEEAMIAASADDFINAHEEGLAMLAGEMGANLSGGQKQRIALARAFYRNAPILLLDEATSALDADTEAKIQTALVRLSKGRTTLVIAHRLATIKAADKIVVMANGKVVEEGSHDELIAQKGHYAELASKQFA